VVAELGFRYDHAAQIFQLIGKTKMEGRPTLLFNPIFHFHDTLTQATKKGTWAGHGQHSIDPKGM